VKKKIRDAFFSSETAEWATPQDFFDKLDGEFNFNLDPCATSENAKCPIYFTKKENGLIQAWFGRVFMNPPYGREIGKWIRKAYLESLRPETFVVCLIPSRTDTKWWHKYVMKAKEIRFIRGRLKFVGVEGVKHPAMFPSAVVIFDGEKVKYPKIVSY